MQIFNLFPTSILQYELERDFTKIELNVVSKKLEKVTPNTFNRYSSDKQVLEDNDLIDLRVFCEESIKHFCHVIFENNLNLRISQSWLNETMPNEQHHRHCHPNSLISGVLYIQTKDEDKIEFYSSNQRYKYWQGLEKNSNIFNANSWWLPAKKGSLLLFLSDVEHSVRPVIDGRRISLSFNTIINEDYGSVDSLTFAPLDITSVKVPPR